MRRIIWTFGLLFLCTYGSFLHAVPHEERWTESLSGGTDIEVLLRKPAVHPEPLPAIILFGGFEGTAQILDHVHADRALIRTSFAYPWTPPEALRPWNLGAVLADFERAVDHTLEGISRLFETLRARDDVDPERIIIVGASAGAPFATIGGAQAQAPGLVIVQGFGEVKEVITHQFSQALERRWGRIGAPLGRWLGRFLVWRMDLPEPEAAARQLTGTQRVLMVNAQDDERIPAATIESLWRAIQRSGAQATRHDMPGRHLRGFGDPAIEIILAEALRWMEDEGLIDPE